MSHQPSKSDEYNMPSIEHNGEQWIRLVDHIALTEKAREEGIKKARKALADWQCIWRDTPMQEHYGIEVALRIIKDLIPPTPYH